MHLTLIQNFTSIWQHFFNFSAISVLNLWWTTDFTNPYFISSLFYTSLYLLRMLCLYINYILIFNKVLCQFSQFILLKKFFYPSFYIIALPFWILSETAHEKRPIFTSYKTCFSPPLYFIECSACKRPSIKVL